MFCGCLAKLDLCHRNQTCMDPPSKTTLVTNIIMFLTYPVTSRNAATWSLLRQVYFRYWTMHDISVTLQVLLDGVDIRKLNVSWLRSKIGVVSQEPSLFGSTIYDNISYGHHNVEYQDVVKAALMANAHSFISALPKVIWTCITIYYVQSTENKVEVGTVHCIW